MSEIKFDNLFSMADIKVHVIHKSPMNPKENSASNLTNTIQQVFFSSIQLLISSLIQGSLNAHTVTWQDSHGLFCAAAPEGSSATQPFLYVGFNFLLVYVCCSCDVQTVGQLSDITSEKKTTEKLYQSKCTNTDCFHFEMCSPHIIS